MKLHTWTGLAIGTKLCGFLLPKSRLCGLTCLLRKLGWMNRLPTGFVLTESPPPNNKPPQPPNNKYSPNMVYYKILGIFIIRGVRGFIIRGRGLPNIEWVLTFLGTQMRRQILFPSFHFIFHFLFHLILHYSSSHFIFHYPNITP